jgi:hypothetical protein
MIINESYIENEMFSADDVGTVFIYKDRVFRGINKLFIDKIKKLFECGLIDELIEKNLIPKTWLTDYKSDKYNLIVEHRKIEKISYCFEWSFSMLKDAALLILNIEGIANKYGYQLKDPHAYNVVFDLNQMLYIDLGSFVEREEESVWIGRNDFVNSFYVPLILMSKGRVDLGRILLYQYNYLSFEEYLRIINPFFAILPSETLRLIKLLNNLAYANNDIIEKKLDKKTLILFAIKVRNILNKKFNTSYFYRYIVTLEKPKSYSTFWAEYHNSIDPCANQRMIYIKNIIKKLPNIRNCLEIGANQGVFLEYILNSTDIHYGIGVDYDEGAIDKMYLSNKDNTKIQAVLANPFTPDLSDYYPSFYERFKSDLVIGMAVTHHLILTQKIDISYIVNKFHSLTNNYLIIEFMPLGLYSGDEFNIPELPFFYNEDWFIRNIKNKFNIISRRHVEKNRIVFLCQKI